LLAAGGDPPASQLSTGLPSLIDASVPSIKTTDEGTLQPMHLSTMPAFVTLP
jgi:hypothetical protein